MADTTTLTATATPDAPRRRTRWDGMTAEQRRDAMKACHVATSRAARERRITALIAKAPPLTDEQRARLMVLLGGQAVTQ